MLVFPRYVKFHKSRGTVFTPPLGAAYLASAVRKKCAVRVVDCAVEDRKRSARAEVQDGDVVRFGISPRELETLIEKFMPDLIGVSCLYPAQFPDIAEIARRTKRIDPGILVVCGGLHPSLFSAVVLEKHPEIDLILRGESERTLPELIERWNRDESIAEIDGLAFRENGIRVNDKKCWIGDLDEIDFPAWDLLPMERYFSLNRPMNAVNLLSRPRSKRNVPVLSSRGCPHRCSFCASSGYWGNRYRARSPENVVAEMLLLKERYRVGEIQFIDDNFTLDRDRAFRLFRMMIEKKLELGWCAPNGVQIDTLDDRMLESMRASGCYELFFAVESGCQEVLDRIVRKPLDLSRVPGLVKKARGLGIRVNAFFMIGLPGESLSQVRQTLRFAREIGVDFPIVLTACPQEGTEIRSVCEKEGWLSQEEDVFSTNYFSGRIQTPAFSPAQIDRLNAAHYRRFFLKMLLTRPARMLGTLLPAIVRPRCERFSMFSGRSRPKWGVPGTSGKRS